ncbi:MAG: hypothetical protein D6766_03010 [Verrucomicrobia bacterium]|nr:MAG: hypothetical protein D6766_03010 [Verrucomicrobiota bacterium]
MAPAGFGENPKPKPKHVMKPNLSFRPLMGRSCGLLLAAGLSLGSVHATVREAAWLQGNLLEDGSAVLVSDIPASIQWNLRSSIDPDVFEHDFNNPTQLIVKQDGDYLVAATLPVQSTSGDRPTPAIEVYVNGAPVPGAISQCGYVRNLSNHNESSDHLHVLAAGLKAGDVIELKAYKVAGITVPLTLQTASLYVERVTPDRAVFAATSAGPTDDPNLLRNFANGDVPAELPWTGVRKDAGFTHNDGQTLITLDAAGDYLVFVNIPLEGTVQRASVGLEILLNQNFSAPVGYAQQGYIRNASGHTESSLHYAGVIRVDSPGTTLMVQTLKRGGQDGTITIQTDKVASIYIEKLGGSGLFTSTATEVDNDTPNDWNPVDKAAIRWRAPLSLDGAVYGHTPDGTEITIKQPGDYLLVYNDSVEQAGTARSNNRITVEVNGVPQPGAETKSHYIRNSNGHQHSSGALVYLLEGLQANDVVTLSTQREAAGGVVGLPATFDDFVFPEEVARVSLIRKPAWTPDPANPAPPRLVQFGGDYYGFNAVLQDLGLAVNPDTITAEVDGQDITADLTVSKDGVRTQVGFTYALTAIPPAGSAHQVVLRFNDTADPPQSHEVSVGFLVSTPFVAVPPEYAVQNVDRNAPGFVAHVTQISTEQSGSGHLHGNTIDGANRQIAGEFTDPNTGQPYFNEADTSGATTWHITPIDVPGIINFEQDADGDGIPGPAGNLVAPDYPDEPIPGIPGVLLSYDGIAAEFLTYLEFPAGMHTLGVNSDDGFQVTLGPNVKDVLGLVLGEFDGGRGAADTLFNVLVPEAGVYPVRLLWFEGTGGASVEFFSVVDGEKIPINANDPRAIKAYRAGDVRPYISRIDNPDGTISPTIGFDITDGEVAVVDGSVKLMLDGVEVAPTVTKVGNVTTVVFDNGGPFAPGQHVAVLSYDEASSPVVTRTVEMPFRAPGGLMAVLEDGPIAYWRLGETEGVEAYSEVGDNLTSSYVNHPVLGQPRIVVGDTATCVLFESERDSHVDIPDHPDINNRSGNPGWKYKTVELWFKARNLPTNDPLWDNAPEHLTKTQVLYEQGGITRGISIYIRGTQPGPNPAQAELWINTLNRAEEAWGGSMPYDATDASGNILSPNGDPVAVHTTIEAGKLYHLVAVIEGDDSAPDSFNGTLKGYLNGQLFGTATGVHILYNHTDDVAIGARNEECPFHDFIYNGTWNSEFYNLGDLLGFDGWIGHVALYNTALSPERIQVHYTAGTTEVPIGGQGGIKTFSFADGVLTIEYEGTLKSAPAVTGPWTPVEGATSPYQTATSEAARFFLAE